MLMCVHLNHYSDTFCTVFVWDASSTGRGSVIATYQKVDE